MSLMAGELMIIGIIGRSEHTDQEQKYAHVLPMIHLHHQV
jgi:hypothetical protein